MQTNKIETSQKFDQLTEKFRTLNVWNFGPLADLDDDEDGEIQVLTGEVDGLTVAYLIADGSELWHIETRDGHGGHGYARRLTEAAGIDFVYEVCSEAGAKFCEALDLEFDDCR